MNEVPKIVLEAAKKEGFNHAEYACTYNGSQAYSVGIKDENGMFEPIGMPMFLLLRNNQVRYANEKESEQLCSRL